MGFPVLHNLEILNVRFQSSFDQINMSRNVFDQCNDTKIATPFICPKDTSLDMAEIMTTKMPHLLQKIGTITLIPFMIFPFSSGYSVRDYTIYFPRKS